MPNDMFEYAQYRKAQAAAKKGMSRATGPALIEHENDIAAARATRTAAMASLEKEYAAAMVPLKKTRADAIDAAKRRYEEGAPRQGTGEMEKVRDEEIGLAESEFSGQVATVRRSAIEAKKRGEETYATNLSEANAKYDEALLVASVKYNKAMSPLKERYEKALRRIQEGDPDADAEHQGRER